MHRWEIIRRLCIKYDWYRLGTVREYDSLCYYIVSGLINVYDIACDIVEHSEDVTIGIVLYILEHELKNT